MYNGYRTGRDVVGGRLYHYEKFRPEWLENTLRNKEIYCTDPAKLNDPWDCRVSFNYTSMLSDPLAREKMLALQRRALSPETFIHPSRPVYEDRIRNSDEELTKTVEQKSGFLTEALQQRRIYCLTPKPLSTLMWSHYGGDHTGICLEFHVGNALFLRALEVQYRETYPVFDITQMDTPRVMGIMLTKAKCWDYEEEYRLIGSPKHPDADPLKLFGDFLKLPDWSLLSVIVGCNGDYNGVKAVVDVCAPGLRVIHIKRAPNEYNLMMDVMNCSSSAFATST
jgi:hypothetical protein